MTPFSCLISHEDATLLHPYVCASHTTRTVAHRFCIFSDAFFFGRFWFRCCSCLCVDELCLNSGSSSRLRLLSRFFLNVWFLGPGLMQLRCVVFKCGRELETMHNGGYQRESEMQHWVYFISFFFLFLNGFHGSLHPPAVRQRQGELGEQQPVWWRTQTCGVL